ITLSQSPAAGSLVGPGVHTITVTATDEAGNSSTRTTTFTVSDTRVPRVSRPASTSASADGSCQATVPDVLGGVTVSDNCSATNRSEERRVGKEGRFGGRGAQTIKVTATDEAGNSDTCTTSFTVSDTSVPAACCPA